MSEFCTDLQRAAKLIVIGITLYLIATVILASLFFLTADQVISWLVSLMLSIR